MSRGRGAEPTSLRLYRRLVALWPGGFRARFGRAMVEDFADLLEAEGAAAAWGRAARDVVRSLPAAWVRAAAATLRPESGGRQAGPSAFSPAQLARDLRFAVRSLRRDPGFSVTAVAVLALAIGAGTTVLGVVNAYLLRPLPYPDAHRLVDIDPALPLTLDEARDVLEIPLTWELDVFTLVGDDRPEQARGSWVVPGFFEAYGVQPALGRTFRPEEAGEGGASVAIVSHGLWQSRFGGDPEVLGRTVRAYSSDRPDDAEVFTVVGVLPADLWLHHAYTDFVVPLRSPNPLYQGRLRPDVSLGAAAAALTDLARGRIPELAGGERVELTPLAERYTARVRPTLVLLAAAVGLVLLIACGNVAVLLVVRAHRRARELSVRRALGAGRGAVAAQLVVEGLVLSAAAAVGGAALANVALELLGAVVEARLGLPVPGGPDALRLDATVLAALAGFAALVGLLFGLAPMAAGAAGGGPAGIGARPDGGRAGVGRGGRRVQGLVVAGELALSLALLVAATLAVRSARSVAAVDLGFESSGLVSAGLMLRERSYPAPEERLAFQRRLAPALARLPGVTASGIAVRSPVGSTAPSPFETEGPPLPDGVPTPRGWLQVADPGYFEALGLAVVRGRGFGPQDDLDGLPVALVSRSLAGALWPGQDPLGQRVREGMGRGAMAHGEVRTAPWRTVVGVVPDVRQDPLDESMGQLYVPAAQEASRYATVVLRLAPGSALPARELEAAVAALDPEVAVSFVQHLGDVVRERSGPLRFLAFLLAAFGVVAVTLAVLGLYGTVAYAAAQRRRDVAIRMAMGARRGEVVRMFVTERLGVLGVGVALGLGGAVPLTRLLEGQLQGVAASDPATWAGAACLLTGVALAAVWLPARKAARAHPMRVLREE